jgi:hypothetical protein
MPKSFRGVRRMRPDTSMSTWVPAIHAGPTRSYNDYVTHANLMAIILHPSKFSKEHVVDFLDFVSFHPRYEFYVFAIFRILVAVLPRQVLYAQFLALQRLELLERLERADRGSLYPATRWRHD